MNTNNEINRESDLDKFEITALLISVLGLGGTHILGLESSPTAPLIDTASGASWLIMAHHYLQRTGITEELKNKLAEFIASQISNRNRSAE